MSPPVGLLIGNPNKPWKIGRLLGSGACGSVHELDPPVSGSSSFSSLYAVKIVNLPKSASSKGKKRKKTAEERNADLLLWEYNLLNANLGEMRGRYVPDIPFTGPPVYGEMCGFRFLVMERMSNPFQDAVSILLESHCKCSAAAKIPLGNVAIAMLDCIRAMHEKGFVFVDVKPENFMLSRSSSTKSGKSAGKSSASDLSQRIRLIDFGLVEGIHDMSCSSHRENMHPGAALVGTPNYASLNVMSGHTVSRRDDLEALGYVLSELILMLGASSESGSTGSRKKSKGKTDAVVLPWGDAKTDDDLYQIKLEEMDESKRKTSRFFSGLKALGADAIMGDFFTIVQKLKYAEKPDYNKLEKLLKPLTVKGGAVVSKTRAIATSPKATNRKKIVREEASDDSDDLANEDQVEHVSGKKQKVTTNVEIGSRQTRRTTRNNPGNESRVSARKPKAARKEETALATKKARDAATQTSLDEVISIASSGSEVEVNGMDWEKIDDENIPPGVSDSERKAVLRLEIVGGPLEGQAVSFGGDHADTLVIGRDPSNASTRAKIKNATKLALDGDNCVSAVHAKLVLHSVKDKVHSLRVTDMQSSNGTFVNGNQLAKGKSIQVFIGGKIIIGESTFEVKKG